MTDRHEQPWRLNSSSALLLQVVIALVGLCVLGFLLFEPHVEGRNAHATTFEIYFHDPFLAYAYAGSIPFFLALYRAFRLAGHVRDHGARSQGTVEALRAIAYWMKVFLVFVAGGVVFILMFGDPDDRPAGMFMSLLVALPSIAAAIAAARWARTVHNSLG